MTYKRHKDDLQGAQGAIDLIINQLKQLVTLDFMHILKRTTDSNKTQVSIYFGGLAKLTISGLGDNHDFTTKEGFTYIFDGVKPGPKEDNLGI